MKKVNLIGKRFGKLVALERKTDGKRSYYYCECDCGNTLWLRADVLQKATSCGCIRLEKLKTNNAPKMIKKHLEKNIIEDTNLSIIKSKNPRSDNTSGHKGVSFDKERNLWVAQIWFKKKHYFLGRTTSKEDAVKLREEAEHTLFDNFLEWYYKTKEGKNDE